MYIQIHCFTIAVKMCHAIVCTADQIYDACWLTWWTSSEIMESEFYNWRKSRQMDILEQYFTIFKPTMSVSLGDASSPPKQTLMHDVTNFWVGDHLWRKKIIWMRISLAEWKSEFYSRKDSRVYWLKHPVMVSWIHDCFSCI